MFRMLVLTWKVQILTLIYISQPSGGWIAKMLFDLDLKVARRALCTLWWQKFADNFMIFT